jgi:hypothetical protein
MEDMLVELRLGSFPLQVRVDGEQKSVPTNPDWVVLALLEDVTVGE